MHLTDSLTWRAITNEEPPTTPVTPAEYERRGIPWFSYYDENRGAGDGSGRLSELESVADRRKRIGDPPLPGNESVDPGRIVKLRRGLEPTEVRQGEF